MDWIRHNRPSADHGWSFRHPPSAVGWSIVGLCVACLLALPVEGRAQSPGARPVAGGAYAEVEPGRPFEAPAAEALSARRSALLDSIGVGVVILPSASTKSIEGDYPQDSDFRQHNDFFYLTGLETPDSWLMLSADANGARSESLFIPERNPDEEQWTGRKPSFAEAAAISGIASVQAGPEFARTLQRAVFFRMAAPTVYAPLNRHTRDDEVVRQLVFDAAVTVQDIEPVMAKLRLVKDDHELRMLRRAIDITTAAHRAAMRAARPGMHEYELEAVIEFNFRLGGAERVGFPSIVGSGPNSVVLHYDKSRRMIEPGDLVVMDIGAEYSYYTADVTRTIPISGRFTERQRQIYTLVLGAQQAALDAIRPGVTVGDLTRVSRLWLRENSGGACGEQSCDAYFIHGLSHWLGMDVHDVGSYETPLQPGMVLTIEPGIYLPGENLGVRIEDDILVTETGYENLSAGAPRDPDQIEALMADEVAQ
jgi:Xaa-Pro aminopeptidase